MEADYSLFEATDEKLYNDLEIKASFYKSEVLLLSIMNGIKHYYYLDNIYSIKASKEYPKLKAKIKQSYYNKLFQLVLLIDSEKLEEFLRGNKDLKKGIKAIDDFLNYFIEIEDYNKCISIKKIKDLLEKS